MGPAGGGQVFRHRGEAALVRAAQVGGHALAPVQNLHRARRDADLQDKTHQRLRHAVAVAIELDVLVNVHPHRFVNGQLPGLRRQGLQRGGSISANALARLPELNDVLRMLLGTMFRALRFWRMVFCLREARSDLLTGRFGLGENSDSAVRAMKVPRKAPGDLFAAVCLRGADTLINDATQPRMLARLPQWYREGINAPTFLLLPLHIKGQPFALIYADQSVADSITVDEKARGLLRTLRNQAVMAFRQAGRYPA